MLSLLKKEIRLPIQPSLPTLGVGRLVTGSPKGGAVKNKLIDK